jgi:hypothetical protein
MMQIPPPGVKMKGFVAIAFVLLLAFTFVPMIAAAGDNSPPIKVAILLQTPSQVVDQELIVVPVTCALVNDADSKSATNEPVLLIGDTAPNTGMADRLPHTRDQTS